MGDICIHSICPHHRLPFSTLHGWHLYTLQPAPIKDCPLHISWVTSVYTPTCPHHRLPSPQLSKSLPSIRDWSTSDIYYIYFLNWFPKANIKKYTLFLFIKSILKLAKLIYPIRSHLSYGDPARKVTQTTSNDLIDPGAGHLEVFPSWRISKVYAYIHHLRVCVYIYIVSVFFNLAS